ncbi:hypothetical protein H0N96_02430, partial [Candidatus Micrarchaeota archaeon]|nr:hypothetical protein [Candidatus Micrarchaeota archaeon]
EGRWFFPCSARTLALNAIRKAISPSSIELPPDSNNFSAVNYEYLMECCTNCHG